MMVKVTIALELDGNTIVLTESAAKELFGKLNELFGNNGWKYNYYPLSPLTIPIQPWITSCSTYTIPCTVGSSSANLNISYT